MPKNEIYSLEMELVVQLAAITVAPADPEIATPPLSGTILSGVTRMSLLDLGKTWASCFLVNGPRGIAIFPCTLLTSKILQSRVCSYYTV